MKPEVTNCKILQEFFFENYNICAQIKALKIRLVLCYGMNWIYFFGRQCILENPEMAKLQGLIAKIVTPPRLPIVSKTVRISY